MNARVHILIVVVLSLAWLGSAEAKRAMTAFDVQRDGFNFANTFNNDFVKELDVRTGGLCGGMVYTALDHFHRRRGRIPRIPYRPANRTPLQSYIYNRQVASLESNVDQWAEIGTNPGGARNDEFYRWGMSTGKGGRLGQIMASIDKGHPAPLGIIGGAGNSATHQVMAIGYDTHGYRGDLGRHQDQLEIFIYDPNHPNKVMTLVPDVGRKFFYYKELAGTRDEHKGRWQGYFVDSKYRANTPPATLGYSAYAKDGFVDELLFTFHTGNDDLRGGRDNLDVRIVYKGGATELHRNVNRSARWLRMYQEWARVKLTTRRRRAEDIERIELTTTSRGGVAGDNWDLFSIRVEALDGNPYEADYREIHMKRNAHRFTGDHPSLRLQLAARPVVTAQSPTSKPALAAGSSTRLKLEIRTGNDDRRSDNMLSVTVLLANGTKRTVADVARGREYKDGTLQFAYVRLSPAVLERDIRGVVLTTSSRGGMGGDNWNMDGIKIIAEPSGTVMFERSKPDNQETLFRFTGQRYNYTARF